MLPYAKGEAWTYQQIKPSDDKSGFANLARIAASRYPDVDSFYPPAQYEDADYLFTLTH
jgi:hypothetical protein